MRNAAIPTASGVSAERFFGAGGPVGIAGFASAGTPTSKRINPDRLGDVLELGRAEIDYREIEPPLDLPVGVLGKTDRARLANALDPRGDIDAVAHQIAVALLDDVAEMNADAEFYAALRRQAGVALDEAVLHLDRAAHRVDHATEFDEAAIPGALDDSPMMRVDGGIDEIAAQPPEPRQRAVFVSARKTAVANDIRDQDRRYFAGPAHGAPSGPRQHSTKTGRSRGFVC